MNTTINKTITNQYEFESVRKAVLEYLGDTMHESGKRTMSETEMLEWLQDNTTVIEFDGGIIVQDF